MSKLVLVVIIFFLVLSACVSVSNEPLPVRLTSEVKEKSLKINRRTIGDSIVENKLNFEIWLNNPLESTKKPFGTIFSIYMDTLYLPEGANLRIVMCGNSIACLYRSNSGSGNFSEKISEFPIKIEGNTLKVSVPIDMLMNAWEYDSSLKRDGTVPRSGVLVWSNIDSTIGSISLQTISEKILVPNGLQEPLFELKK